MRKWRICFDVNDGEYTINLITFGSDVFVESEKRNILWIDNKSFDFDVPVISIEQID